MKERASALDGFELPAKPARVVAVDASNVERFLQKGPSKLRRKTAGRRVCVYLAPELVPELRARAFREDCSVSDLVTRAVAEFMK